MKVAILVMFSSAFGFSLVYLIQVTPLALDMGLTYHTASYNIWLWPLIRSALLGLLVAGQWYCVIHDRPPNPFPSKRRPSHERED